MQYFYIFFQKTREKTKKLTENEILLFLMNKLILNNYENAANFYLFDFLKTHNVFGFFYSRIEPL